VNYTDRISSVINLAQLDKLIVMIYSQKYCLVHFISPVDTGAQFNMSEWPLHITLADVFAVDRQNTTIDIELESLCKQQSSITIAALDDSKLGETPVVLLHNTSELFKFHSELVSTLEHHGAIFNTPAFTMKGFIPHSTIQDNGRIEIGQEITIDSISLVDMFPDSDWEQRKVLATLNLK
jgi:2'-5' RNA ligase